MKTLLIPQSKNLNDYINLDNEEEIVKVIEKELIEQKFNLKIVRRTITKYRAQLNIASSSERKKLYKISLNSH